MAYAAITLLKRLELVWGVEQISLKWDEKSLQAATLNNRLWKIASAYLIALVRTPRRLLVLEPRRIYSIERQIGDPFTSNRAEAKL